MTREQLRHKVIFGEIAIAHDAALRKYVEAYCGLPDFGECEEVEI